MNPQRNLNDSDIENAGHPGYVSPSANAAPKPLSDGKYAQPVPHQKGVRSFHALKVILISGLLLAAAIGVIAAVLLFAQSSTKRTANEQKKAGETKLDPLTAQQTIERTAVYFKGQEKAKTPLTIPIKVKGKNFYTVIPDVDILQSLAGYVPKEMSKQQRESIEKSLDYDKFVKKVFSEGDEKTAYLADFTRDDVVCQLSVDPAEHDTKGDWTELRCLDVSAYTPYADAQQPLAKAYSAVTSTAAHYGFIGKPMPKDGALSGYKLVEIPVGAVTNQRMTTPDNLGMFYQMPDGLWYYFRDRNRDVYVECENFTGENQRRAYADQPCRRRSTGTIETVKYGGKR
ncbi:MAG: hypothetical protein ACFNNB_00105 [Candidatus Saccharimonas sp.]